MALWLHHLSQDWSQIFNLVFSTLTLHLDISFKFFSKKIWRWSWIFELFLHELEYFTQPPGRAIFQNSAMLMCSSPPFSLQLGIIHNAK